MKNKDRGTKRRAAPCQLPDALLSRVLLCVDLQHRVTACSLVCKAWRAAAAAASNDICVSFAGCSSSRRRRSAAAGLSQWLQAHGSAVKRLSVHGSTSTSESQHPLLELPFEQLSQLQQLKVDKCMVQWTGLAGLTSLSGLQQLYLDVTPLLPARPRQYYQLDLTDEEQALYAQQQTQWEDLSAEGQFALQESFAIAIELLSCQTQLKVLALNTDMLIEIIPVSFDALPQLRELRLFGDGVFTPMNLERLPPGLTKLQMHWVAREPLDVVEVPQMAGLTALQHLELSSATKDSQLYSAGAILPDFCSSMPQLRVLKLSGKLNMSTMDLLADVLPGLQQLQSLVVYHSFDNGIPLHVDSLSRYSGLLRNAAQLTRLELSWEDGALLHAGCGPYLFAAGRQLPQLKQLVLGVPSGVYAVGKGGYGLGEHVQTLEPCFGPGDMDLLAKCCPGLKQLCVAGLVQPGVDMRPLLQLTALTHLCVGGDVVDDDVVGSVIAQLSGLRHLEICKSSEHAGDHGLLRLAALTQLSALQVVHWLSLSPQLYEDEDGYYDTLAMQSNASPPDVHLQLLQRLLRSDVCRGAALAQLLAHPTGMQAVEAHLAAMEHRVDHLQMQLSHERLPH